MSEPNYLLMLADLAGTIQANVSVLEQRVAIDPPDAAPQELSCWLVYGGIPDSLWGGSLDVCQHAISVVVAVPNNGGSYASRVRAVNAAAAAVREAVKRNVVLSDGAGGAVMTGRITTTGAAGAQYANTEIVAATVTATYETKVLLEVIE